jgi:hypothetical protein
MPGLIALIIQQLPTLVPAIKDLFAKQNPGAPPLTDAQVHDAFLVAVSSTIAKDDAYLSATAVVIPDHTDQ